MWFSRKHRRQRMKVAYMAIPAVEAGEPRGVRIVRPDGTRTECTLTRDPEPSADGHAQWIANPPAGALFDPGKDSLEADYIPAATIIMVPLIPE